MLKERAGKFYIEDNNLNCAESILYSANEEYDIDLDQKTLDTMSSFGGGMAVESVCGALTGAVAVLGVMITGDKSLDKEKRKAIVTDFYVRFQEKFGTDNCKEIKGKYRDETTGCQEVVKISADILEEIIRKYRQ
jgi:C_GCAxxG_C_C family probable redox protein